MFVYFSARSPESVGVTRGSPGVVPETESSGVDDPCRVGRPLLGKV